MSNFVVKTWIVESVQPAENSDRLDLVKLEGLDYQFITERGLYEPGVVVVYFPVDSLLPKWITDVLGLTGKLAYGEVPEDGSERLQNRVKTIKLRGNFSQGVVCTPEDLMRANEHLDSRIFELDENIADDLGIRKYEPPVIASNAGNLHELPSGVNKYDIENAEYFREIIKFLMDRPVFISEKVEGSHWWLSLIKDDTHDKPYMVFGQRNKRIEPVEGREHDWFKVIRLYNLEEIAHRMWATFDQQHATPTWQLTIRGEIVGPGIQGNYYGLKEHAVYIFDIERNGKVLNAEKFLAAIRDFKLLYVPILVDGTKTLAEWLNGKTLREASNGRSLLNLDKKREGVVIKPMENLEVPEIGRMFLKQRSPEYLAKSDL